MLQPKLLVADEPVSALDVSGAGAGAQSAARPAAASSAWPICSSRTISPVVQYVAHDVLVMYLGLAIEHGPKERIFGNPLHPYTQALLASTPAIGGDAPAVQDPPRASTLAAQRAEGLCLQHALPARHRSMPRRTSAAAAGRRPAGGVPLRRTDFWKRRRRRSAQFPPDDRRAIDHRLELAEGDIARQIFHAAVGCDRHQAVRASCTRSPLRMRAATTFPRLSILQVVQVEHAQHDLLRRHVGQHAEIDASGCAASIEIVLGDGVGELRPGRHSAAACCRPASPRRSRSTDASTVGTVMPCSARLIALTRVARAPPPDCCAATARRAGSRRRRPHQFVAPLR